MKRTRIGGAGFRGIPIFFLLAGLAAGLSGVLVYIVLQASAPTASVTVAARNIPAYTMLTSDDLAVVTIPAGGVPAGAIRDKSMAVGHYADRSFLPGDVIRERHLDSNASPTGPLAAALANPTVGGRRIALSLPGELAPGIMPDLVPGDRLVVLGYVPATAGTDERSAELNALAPDAHVLRVTVPVDATGTPSIREATVVVAVTETEALSIMRALTEGIVSLALLPPDGGGLQ